MNSVPEPLYLKYRVRRHLSELLRLATPVAISRTSIVMLATIDIAMLGRTGAHEVAYYALGMSPFIILMVTGIGLLFGTTVSTSHAIGTGDFKKAGAVWRNSLPHACLIGLLFVGLSQLGEGYFRITGQSEDFVQGSKTVFALLGASLLPTMLYVTSAFFLEALKRPGPVMCMGIIANILNVAGNYLFIYGDYTDLFPAMGADGAALSTALARCIMGFGLVGYIWWLKDRDKFGIRIKQGRGWIADGKIQRRYGYAAGLSFGMETLAFGIMSIFAGWMGATQLAIYGVSMNLMAVLFMVSLGLSSATSIRVGIAHGRQDWPDRALAGWTGLMATVCVLASLGLIVAWWPEIWVKLYFDETDLILGAIPAFIIIGFIIITDGLQVVVSQTLRAAADSWVPTLMAFISYLLIMTPLGWVFGIYYGRGAYGLFEAIVIGSVFSSCILVGRWMWLCKNPSKTKI